ncbi:Hemerythrin HHE cation binding domain protein [Cystobacter fuscus DSM 2262]|uniref:Hemerythrin HHE cation binding domain protein n=1 Tax=Cystobacter fuscus (strain ATCC 25194 / DSM 2262 / NBRC 100088 / M29) TaxID=1242864 RepID=S9NZR0_CYSF2|nr:hemerythrin domain-containing protein [Cystobacter fuscus]EPX56361.1 Hemerythrin HHE cation binding domain protein [Cystobacter fuscus DSM 2262]
MDAIELLTQQHREVEELFEKFEKAGEGKEELLRELFVRIADNLAAHAIIEEKLFYPNVYVGPTADQLQEAVEEHLSVKRVIADLLDMEPSDAQFKAKVKVLKDLVEHHVEEEEKELFKSVKKLLTKEELSVMGEQLEVMFSELIQTEPRMQVPREIDEAAPLT